MEGLISALDENLSYGFYEIQGEELWIYVNSSREKANCPYCGQPSEQVHSRKIRTAVTVKQKSPCFGKQKSLVFH